MKWLFYLLVLANLLFFAWHWQYPVEGPAASPPPATTQGEQLRLLSELSQPPDPRSAGGGGLIEEPRSRPPERSGAGPVAEAEEVSPPAWRCHRISGLADKTELAAVREALAERRFEVVASGTEPGEKKRYWVLLPPYGSAAEAAPVLERLKAAGLEDYYLVGGGENHNAISLGIFSSIDAAQRRYRQIRDLGLQPEARELAIPVHRYWMTVREPDDAEETEWRSIIEARPDVSAEGTACP